MGDVFIHLLPSLYQEIYKEEHDTDVEKSKNMLYINGFIFIGIVICYTIEVLINNYFHIGHDHHNHDKKDHIHEVESNRSTALITIAFLGDMFHNFTDGLAIASTFMLNRKLGVATVIACFFHEIPHEIGDFTFMFKNNWSYFKALTYQMLTGWGAIIGAYLWLTFASKATTEMAAIAGGTFIYLSMWMFMEDLRKTHKIDGAIMNIILMLFGFMFMFYSNCIIN